MGTEKEDVLERVRALEGQLAGGAPTSGNDVAATTSQIEDVIKSMIANGQLAVATSNAVAETSVKSGRAKGENATREHKDYIHTLMEKMTPATRKDLEYIKERWKEIKEIYIAEEGIISRDYLDMMKLHDNADGDGFELIYYDDGSNPLAASAAKEPEVSEALMDIIHRASGRTIKLQNRVIKGADANRPDLSQEEYLNTIFEGYEVKKY